MRGYPSPERRLRHNERASGQGDSARMASEATQQPHLIESRAAKTIREAFESGRPLTYIRSAEEQRVAKVLAEVSRKLSTSASSAPAPGAAPLPIWTWSLTEEMHQDQGERATGTQSPRAALDFIAAYPGSAIFHLKDFHEPLR